MRSKSFYYLTEDLLHPANISEIKYLLNYYGSLIVITYQPRSSIVFRSRKLHYLCLDKKFTFVIGLQKSYGRIIYLISRIANNNTDYFFPKRNFYANSKIVTKLINNLWPLKLRVNKYLPKFSTLYYLPLLVKRKFSCLILKIYKIDFSEYRTIVSDSLLTDHYKNINLLLSTAFTKSIKIGLVRSWDNPFYTQFDIKRNSYILWGEEMLKDLRKVHRFNPKVHSYSGPLILKDYFKKYRKINSNQALNKEKSKYIGYAAAFPDKIMIKHEIRLLIKLSKEIDKAKNYKKILFKPYPCVPIDTYEELLKYKNIEIYQSKRVFKRRNIYDDEFIGFDNESDKYNFCKKLNYFISLGTSFTFEALISEVDIVQLWIPYEKRISNEIREIFIRLEISDHITKYFYKNLPIVESLFDAINYETNYENINKYSNLKKIIGLCHLD